MDTSTYHYKSRRPGQAGLEQRMREICQTRVRFGYRRIQVQLRREGWINEKKTRRIYRELGLQLRNKTPKRRVKAKLRDDRRPATRSNETWAIDFVHDQLATGQRLRVLTIVDTFSRFSPALEPRFTFRGADVVDIPEKGHQRVRIAGDDPRRSRDRVCFAEFGFLPADFGEIEHIGASYGACSRHQDRQHSCDLSRAAIDGVPSIYFRAQLVVRTEQPNMRN